MKFGTTVRIARGNPQRGPETGAGFGRLVKGRLIGARNGQFLCVLEQDDPDAVVEPNKKGQSGWWSKSAIQERRDCRGNSTGLHIVGSIEYWKGACFYIKCASCGETYDCTHWNLSAADWEQQGWLIPDWPAVCHAADLLEQNFQQSLEGLYKKPEMQDAD